MVMEQIVRGTPCQIKAFVLQNIVTTASSVRAVFFTTGWLIPLRYFVLDGYFEHALLKL